MPRIVNIFRNLNTKSDPTKTLVELVDYSKNHIIVAVYTGEKIFRYRIKDLVEPTKKASQTEKNLEVTSLGGSETPVKMSEETLYSEFPNLT